jgi:hypothetical protein
MLVIENKGIRDYLTGFEGWAGSALSKFGSIDV